MHNSTTEDAKTTYSTIKIKIKHTMHLGSNIVPVSLKLYLSVKIMHTVGEFTTYWIHHGKCFTTSFHYLDCLERVNLWFLWRYSFACISHLFYSADTSSCYIKIDHPCIPHSYPCDLQKVF